MTHLEVTHLEVTHLEVTHLKVTRCTNDALRPVVLVVVVSKQIMLNKNICNKL